MNPPEAKPTAIHYAFVIAVLIIIVCALSWLIEHQQKVAIRARIGVLAADLGKLKEDLAACRKKADEEKAMAEAKMRTLVAANDAGKVAPLAVDQALNGAMDLPGDARGEDEEPNAAQSIAIRSPLVISIASNRTGQVDWMQTGLAKLFDGPLNEDRLRSLERRLNDIFAIEGDPFDGIVLRVGKDLRYNDLLKIVVVCTRQTGRSGGQRLKIAFVELPEE